MSRFQINDEVTHNGRPAFVAQVVQEDERTTRYTIIYTDLQSQDDVRFGLLGRVLTAA